MLNTVKSPIAFVLFAVFSLIKIYDNAKLQCFKVYDDGTTKFKEEVDLLKMSRCGKSTKHKQCIEVFVRSGFFEKKHKFQFSETQIDEEYVSFIKILDNFTIIKLAQQNKAFQHKRDSIESTSMLSLIPFDSPPIYTLSLSLSLIMDLNVNDILMMIG